MRFIVKEGVIYQIRLSHIFKIPSVSNEKFSILIEIPSISIESFGFWNTTFFESEILKYQVSYTLNLKYYISSEILGVSKTWNFD